MAKHKRVTFEFSAGWLAHLEGKPFDAKAHPDWQEGWYGRHRYLLELARFKP